MRSTQALQHLCQHCFPGRFGWPARQRLRKQLERLRQLPEDQQPEWIVSRIEEAILFAVGDRWTKVAKVIAKVADAMGTDLATGDEGYEEISEHIEVLVRAGRLEAQGNTENWRFSEVRR